MVKIEYEDEGPKEHHEHHENISKKKKSSAERIRENPWVVFTIVLGVFVIVLLVTGGNASCGKVVSEEQAGEDLVGFLNQQTEGGVEYLSSEDLGSIYEITVTYQDQEIPVYITKDGKYYLQGVVDLEEAQEEMGNAENAQTQEPAEVPKSDVPEVELFVMSHCPYGTQAVKGMLPVLDLLGDKIDFELRFVYYAMHPSAGEVEEQLNQYCIQKEQEDKLYEYLECFLTEGDGEGCLTEVGINKAKLKTCTDAADKEFDITVNLEDESSWLSGYYPLFNIDKELNEEYGVRGSPSLVINGEQISSGRSPSAYLSTICNAFTEGNVPEECNEELSTETMSPGFGWTTQSGGSASAQCA